LGNAVPMPNDSAVPVPVYLRFAEITCRTTHAVRRTQESKASCWGFGSTIWASWGHGISGDSAVQRGFVQAAAPIKCLGSTTGFERGRRWRYNVWIGTDSAAYCWDRNASGQLGNDYCIDAHELRRQTLQQGHPVRVRIVGDPQFISLAVGLAHACWRHCSRSGVLLGAKAPEENSATARL